VRAAFTPSCSSVGAEQSDFKRHCQAALTKPYHLSDTVKDDREIGERFLQQGLDMAFHYGGSSNICCWNFHHTFLTFHLAKVRRSFRLTPPVRWC